MEFSHGAVIGTGMMGPGIAVSLALGGVTATVVSRTEAGAEQGRLTALKLLVALRVNEIVTEQAAADAKPLIHASGELDKVAHDAQIVIESAPESMELKQALFARLDAVTAPDAVLASNTSGLSITEIASKCVHPERVLTTHFWNPPHLMPLVEIVRGERTSEAVLAAVRQLMLRCGKAPVMVKKDRPGQLGNRLQMALVREAVNIVQEGIADVDDVDRAARLGFGLRLPAYGILEHQDIVGLRLGHAVCDYVARDLNNEPRAPELYRSKIAAGETGVDAGRGFYDWSKKSAEQVKARRDRFLIDCLRKGMTRE